VPTIHDDSQTCKPKLHSSLLPENLPAQNVPCGYISNLRPEVQELDYMCVIFALKIALQSLQGSNLRGFIPIQAKPLVLDVLGGHGTL